LSQVSDKSRAETALVALAATLAIQIYTSFAASATAVLAPELARDFGVPSRFVGVFVGVVYAGSAVASLLSGAFIVRHGSIRTSQVCVVLCAIGIASMPIVAAMPAGAVVALALAPLLIGAGYGPITPASSQLLARTAPPSRRALTFSIKQTGVPAGVAIAGATLPLVALAIGWRITFAAIAVLGVVIAALAQLPRASLDADRAPARRAAGAGYFEPIRRVLATPALAELAWIAFAYAATQVCLMSFLVVYLHEALGYSLVAAGLALTVANTGGIVGRIVWGAMADRLAAPRTLLAIIGLMAAAGAFATATFGAAWPFAAVLVVCALFGATAIGWNGVQLSEVARHSPPGEAGAITGAAGFIGFGGVVVGPPAFALLTAASGNYRTGFVAIGATSAAFALRLLLTRR
jgi:predicted MFS family arabinose efflux permease